jgi:hypothetical protein
VRQWARHLPWFDGLAALTAGVVVLSLRSWLAPLEGFSLEQVTFIGVVNLAYAIPGLTLGALRTRPAWLLYALIAANLGWFVACLVMAARAWSSASAFGLAQLLGEGLFVTALALCEARYRRVILAPHGPHPAVSL